MRSLLPLLLLAFSHSLASAQINPIGRTSEVSVTDGLSGNPASFSTNEIVSTSFAPFNESLFPATSLSVADQSSSFNNTSISVSTELDNIGTSSFGSDFGGTFGDLSASSNFELIFSINSPSVFSITGALTESDPVEVGVGVNTGSSFFDLSGPTSVQFQSNPLVAQTVIAQPITLLPGTYTLEIGSTGFGSQIEPAADTSAQFTLEFVGQAVPEPSSLVLGGLVMPFVLLRRRRRI